MTNITKERILALFAEIGGMGEAASIEPKLTLAEVGFDSLNMIEMVMAVEEEMAIEISDDDAEKYFNFHSTVADLMTYLEGRST